MTPLLSLIRDKVHAMDRATAAKHSVERALRGVNTGPAAGHRLARRFRRLLQPAGATVLVTRVDKDGVSERLELHLSRLGWAGHLCQEAQQAERTVANYQGPA